MQIDTIGKCERCGGSNYLGHLCLGEAVSTMNSCFLHGPYVGGECGACRLTVENVERNHESAEVERLSKKIASWQESYLLTKRDLAASESKLSQKCADYERLREALENVLNSARPSNKEHPTMYAAWQKARELLTPPPAAGIPEEADAGVAARKSEESSSGGRK